MKSATVISIVFLVGMCGCQTTDYLESRGKATVLIVQCDYETVHYYMHSKAYEQKREMKGLFARTIIQSSFNPIEGIGRVDGTLNYKGVANALISLETRRITDSTCSVTIRNITVDYKETASSECVIPWLTEAGIDFVEEGE